MDAEGRVVALDLSFNNLAGALPSEIQQLSALTMLGLGSNKLTGAIPAELGQLGALKELYLCDNQLSEEIPAELARPIPAIDCLLVTSAGNTTTGLHLRRWPRS